MRHLVTSLMTSALLALGAGLCQADLVDSGASGEFFFDSDTGITWYDPVNFEGQTRAQIDAFVTGNANAQWATSAQVDGLAGKSSQGGVPLVDVMGAPQFILSDGGPRWIGYYEQASQPDGWLAQSFQDPGHNTITQTGFQGNVASWDPGAWVLFLGATAVEPTTWGRIKSTFGW